MDQYISCMWYVLYTEILPIIPNFVLLFRVFLGYVLHLGVFSNCGKISPKFPNIFIEKTPACKWTHTVSSRANCISYLGDTHKCFWKEGRDEGRESGREGKEWGEGKMMQGKQAGITVWSESFILETFTLLHLKFSLEDKRSSSPPFMYTAKDP